MHIPDRDPASDSAPAPGCAAGRDARPELDGRRVDVAVVGAGISGLALTHFCADAGLDVATVEASSDPGGVVRTREVDGRTLDLGPQRTRLTPGVRGLVDDLGLGGETVTVEELPTYVHWDGRLREAPLSPRAALRTDLLSLRGKLRVLLEPLTDPARDGESVAEFLERKFGREAARRAICPVYAGLYGSDPGEMPVEHSLGRAIENAGVEGSLLVGVARKLLRRRIRGGERAPAVTFEGGMARLPEALVAAHADRVYLDTPARSVEGDGGSDPDGSSDPGTDGPRYRVVTDRGTLLADAVALSTPAPVAADLLSESAPGAADRLSRLSYNPMAVVHVSADLDREGMGCLVPGYEYRLLGSTWNADAFGREGVYTCYLGGTRDPDVVEWTDDRIGDLAAREFAAVTGAGDPEVLSVARLRPGMPAYDRSWRALEGLDLPEGVVVCANYADRAGIPGRIRDAAGTAGRLAGVVDGRDGTKGDGTGRADGTGEGVAGRSRAGTAG